MRVRARFLLPALALAGCHGEHPGPAAAPFSVQDLGLAADVLLGEGELWLVPVSEAEQGAGDLNGDGDLLDEVAHVVDLGRVDSAGGPLRNTGLALARLDVHAPLFGSHGGALAFAVSEADQGGHDLNGDGDAEDLVLHVWERASGTARNLGFAVADVQVDGDLVAFGVDEAAQGATDLDGDRDALDTVVHVFDSRDGSVQNLLLHDSAPLAVGGGFVALRAAESPGLDLNVDGDDVDPAVVLLYDASRGVIDDTALAFAGGVPVHVGGVWGFSVDEAAQGELDLSGDGDADDAVFFVYDPDLGLTANLGLVVPLFPPPQVDARRFLLHASESGNAEDANGDGDLEDFVVHVFEPSTGLVTHTGLASQGSAVLAGDWVVVSVSEPMQGSSDLDQDGQAGGNVVHAMELASRRLLGLGVDSFALTAGSTRVFMAPFESTAEIDWNEDGDRQDRVLLDWRPGDRRVQNSGGVVGNVLDAAGDRALLLSAENERGRDQDGDGDLEDLVLEVFDAAAARLVPLGLAVGSGGARLASERFVLALVGEAEQGRDLNGDGDRDDSVLELVTLAP